MHFSERFAKILNDKGLSTYKVSKDTNIPDAMIGRWKNGQALPSFEKLVTLANYLNVSYDFLISGQEKNLPDNDKRLLDAYHKVDEGTRKAIDKLLDL